MQNQRLDASKPRSNSAPHNAHAAYPQAREMKQSSVHSQALAAEGFGSKIAGGGMAALMVQEQKAREGDPITCDDVPIPNRFAI
jgi:hypothetical protein